MGNVYALILAGGSGTRFWPASRRDRPKQVLAIGPDASAPLIARTVQRIAPLCPPERVVIATGEALVPVTREALPWLAEDAFLAEPVARNTAPCIAWAAQHIAARDPEALVMVLPSDSHIQDEAEFVAVLKRALESARTGTITTIGITPTRPETGYGYIEAGAERSPGVLQVARFVEKPDRARAEQYCASGRYYWNSGMFFFRASDMLAAVNQHLPQVAEGLSRIARAAAQGREAELSETRRVFASFPSISIDYGIMEKVSELAVVPGSFGWSDLGSWHTVWELGQPDARGNVGPDGALFVDADRNLVQDLRTGSSKRVVALLGVQDLCVIETDDALLVVPRDRSQDVRDVVEALKARGGPV